MNSALILCAPVIALLVAACTPSAPPAHTVDYYRSHKQERMAKVRECTNNPGELEKTADCANALKADSIEGIGSFRHLPPMELPSAPARNKSP